VRVLVLGNNWVAWQVVRWLKERGEEIVGLVLHPPQKRKYGEEIKSAAGLDSADIFDAAELRHPEIIESIRERRADVALSVLFDYILRPEMIELFPEGVINLHPAYLPFNRGQYPNVWSIVEGTPSGVTLHYIDDGIDTGDVIAQRRVEVDAWDTGETLYRKLGRASVELFQETWPLIRSGRARRAEQPPEAGTYHRTRDVEKIDEIDLERAYRAKELIDILRARTFPPYAGAYFRDGARKVYLRLELIPEEDLKHESDESDN
jgi:methionyl-tRNA formyltransferase